MLYVYTTIASITLHIKYLPYNSCMKYFCLNSQTIKPRWLSQNQTVMEISCYKFATRSLN